MQAAERTDTEAIRPRYMAHFVLYTTRRDELVAWYRTLLNAWVVYSDHRATFITFDDEHHRMVIIQKPGLTAPPPTAWGVAHVAYSFPSLPVLLANFQRLRSAGILPYRSINHGPTTSFYYRDADGNNIEFQADNFDSYANAAAYMNGADFASNVSGVNFDPDELIAKMESGVPIEELKRRPS